MVQIGRFLATGVLSAIVDFGLLLALMFLGLTHTPAKALSFIAGTTTAYLINRRWTFNADASRQRFVAVVILYSITFALQVGLFSVLFTWMKDHDYSQLAAQTVSFVIAQGTATVVNFIVQRVVIFSR